MNPLYSTTGWISFPAPFLALEIRARNRIVATVMESELSARCKPGQILAFWPVKH